ncbi:MAG: 3-methyl-2-oxobutanoate hydroxymethyltransferase [Verrucomicrobiota bacterium]|nr:3-methyl-2-oxobutanoate hydroxymethyltransferase [Verrucomicrobiota bacterium]
MTKITPHHILERKLAGGKISALTAYDYPTAKLIDDCGIDIILVGDSLGMVVLGYKDTTQVTIEDMVHHLSAVARSSPRALIVADLPFGTYENGRDALHHARMLMSAGAEAVKLEGGTERKEAVEAIIAEKIPLMGHIGMLPQNVRNEGGYKIKGRTDAEKERLLKDARFLDKAGVFSMVMELIIPSVSEEVTQTVTCPTIGIGSGPNCDGQVLVIHDLIGAFPWFTPKFVQPKADVSGEILKAIRAWQQSF